MPGTAYNSIKKPRTYEALRRRGYSKRSAARISNAQASAKDSGTTGLAIPPHGPDALFNQPGVGNIRTRRRKRLKALNWGARGGQSIGGRLRRGSDGRFTGSGEPSANGGSAQRERRSEMRAKRQARADERAAAHEAERAQEATTRADEDAYIASGKSGRERQKRRAEIATKRRERAAARVAAHHQEATAEREQRQQEDETEAAQRESEGRSSGGKDGGGGGKKKPGDDAKQAATDKKKSEQRAKTAPRVGLSASEAEALAGVAGGSGAGTADTKRLRSMGLMDDTGATAAGRHLLAALERGDVRGALAAIQAGKAAIARDAAKRAAQQERERAAAAKKQPAPKPAPAASAASDPALARERNQTLAAQIIRNMRERRARRRRKEAMTTKAQQTFGGTKRSDLADSVFAGPDRSFPIKTAQDVHDAVRSLGRTKHDKAAVKRGIIRRARAIGAMDALPDSWKAQKSFTVFKDHTGADRWAAITTTAYEDKDAEWISCKAIRQVVAAGDASGSRGPLRYWHVPGLDLGDCDYQAALDGGRLLLESGTFRSPAAARIGQKAAEKGYQMSPGFLHTRHEPRAGVFDHIAIFERSFVPPGRASNPYTWLVTKESRMLTDEKRKEFEALAGDDEGRALLTELLATAETTTKAADAVGAVYKDAPAWAQALLTRIDTLEAAYKAPPPAALADAAADDTEELDADLGMGDELVADEGAADVGLDDEGFADMLAQKIVAALAPMLELEKKMTGYLGEMKAMLQPAVPALEKDDARAQQIADLHARLKALEGDQPRVRASMAGSVWGDLTGMVVTKEQAAALGAVPAGGDVPAGLSEAEAGAYQLIFGS